MLRFVGQWAESLNRFTVEVEFGGVLQRAHDPMLASAIG